MLLVDSWYRKVDLRTGPPNEPLGSINLLNWVGHNDTLQKKRKMLKGTCELPFRHVFILQRFNSVISLANLMSEVMLIWINMKAVPSFVLRHVMFTQNSAKE